MSMEAGLQSSEVSVIKNARAVAKGKVTKYSNSLDITLVQNGDESFIFDEIDAEKVGEAHANLLSSYDTFQELHERYIDHASLETDENEKKYAKNVAEAFSAINRRYIKFKKYTDKLKNEIKLTTLQKEVSRNRTSLEGKAAAANNIISATDENIKKTANVVKAELRSALDCYSMKVKDYDAALLSVGKGQESKFTEEKDFSDIIKTVEDMMVKLEAIAIEQPMPRQVSMTLPSIEVD